MFPISSISHNSNAFPRPASDGAPDRREHFIPVRLADLSGCLVSQTPVDQQQAIKDLCQILSATFHHQFHSRMESLKQLYAPLDPDRDTITIDATAQGESTGVGTSSCDTASETRKQPTLCQTVDTFVAQTIELLERANFKKLTRQDIEAAMRGSSDWGVNLKVDFELFERLEIYARGDIIERRTRRRFRKAYRAEIIDVPVYQRLVLVFRLHADNQVEHTADPDRVYLKLFKDIPQIDLEMLLPGTRVQITRLDQGKIFLPTASGILFTLFKIIKGVALLATATLTGMLSFLALLGGTIGYGVKSFLGYIRTKDKYHLNLTRSLYFQNLDNNAGVLHRLLDEAEEQEVRESILAWFLLWQRAPAAGWTEPELDAAAESFLEEHFSIDVDFEVDDALAKLAKLGLSHCDGQGKWTATSIAEALRHLDHAWDNLFPWNESSATTTRRVA